MNAEGEACWIRVWVGKLSLDYSLLNSHHLIELSLLIVLFIYFFAVQCSWIFKVCAHKAAAYTMYSMTQDEQNITFISSIIFYEGRSI